MIRVACPGWVYKHWAADFYPADLKPDAWFGHYRQVFDTVHAPRDAIRLREMAG